jgi:hypothetical protein
MSQKLEYNSNYIATEKDFANDCSKLVGEALQILD